MVDTERPTRGEYVTYAHYFHGEDAVGIYSLMDYQAAPELTLAEGFDMEHAATATVVRKKSSTGPSPPTKTALSCSGRSSPCIDGSSGTSHAAVGVMLCRVM